MIERMMIIMPLVYVVDDEANIRQLAAFGLQDAGFETKDFASGNEVLHAMQQRIPDALVLDWMMPPPDGLSVCRTIRENPAQRHLPIILLTARGDEGDRVFGLEFGADDYMTKPFSVKELAARVKALLRRAEYLSGSEETLTRGVFTIDLSRHQLTKNGVPIALSLREFDLFYELMKKPGRVLTREMLLERVWKTEFFGDTRTVDVHVRYLRQKIEDEPDNPQYILTVRGVGYCFAEEKG
ncbi:MAG: response regulator transcription factor [Oscillospiraceae bacterium]|nr:response regulator transcription factor [Oscillospiraceae bacterium]